MKVMVFAEEKVRGKLSVSLASEGIGVTSVSDGVTAVGMMRREKFDLALVDSLAEGVEVACACISKYFGVPVVLLVRNDDVDWKRLQSLEPHGYILDSTGGAEIAARLCAVVRRSREQADRHRDWGLGT